VAIRVLHGISLTSGSRKFVVMIGLAAVASARCYVTVTFHRDCFRVLSSLLHRRIEYVTNTTTLGPDQARGFGLGSSRSTCTSRLRSQTPS
jgi:hypothetical protein